jgi:5'-nucleotidase
MNRIGIDFSAVGNHEFDEGKTELLRMQKGGNHPTDAFSGQGLPADLKAGEFRGADFKFLAANVLDTDNNTTLFPGVGVKNFLGNKVAFVAVTLESTPTIVSPSGVAGLQFQDEADTANALVPQIKAQGIETIVVLIHEGGFPTVTAGNCTGISGAIVDIVNRLHPAIDLVISGHTHQAYSCLINNAAGKPVRVTSAGQYARLLTDIDVTIDTRTKDAVAVSAINVNVGTSTSTVVQALREPFRCARQSLGRHHHRHHHPDRQQRGRIGTGRRDCGCPIGCHQQCGYRCGSGRVHESRWHSC